MSIRAFYIIATSAAGILISACSPMNSKFSCNATAGDNCLTIEQVDAMTRYADGASTSQQKRDHHSHPYVWVAPQNDGPLTKLSTAQNPNMHA